MTPNFDAGEQYALNVQRLEFKDLQSFDELIITTGVGDEAWRYKFDVLNTSRWPAGNLSAVNPEGLTTPQFSFVLHGCGQWTSRRQNPVQQQARAFTPYYDGLIRGSFMWGVFAGQTSRHSFNNPGQEISQIMHVPYRENAVLKTLAAGVGPLSVRHLVELTATETIRLNDTELRSTLNKLVASDHVKLLKKNVQLFQLAESH